MKKRFRKADGETDPPMSNQTGFIKFNMNTLLVVAFIGVIVAVVIGTHKSKK